MLHMWQMPGQEQLAESGGITPASARPLLAGLASGAAGLYAAFVGILVLMHGRVVVVDVVTLGQCFLMLLGLGAGAKSIPPGDRGAPLSGVGRGAIAGAVYGAVLAFGLALFQIGYLRTVLVSRFSGARTLPLQPNQMQGCAFSVALSATSSPPARAPLLGSGTETRLETMTMRANICPPDFGTGAWR